MLDIIAVTTLYLAVGTSLADRANLKIQQEEPKRECTACMRLAYLVIILLWVPIVVISLLRPKRKGKIG